MPGKLREALLKNWPIKAAALALALLLYLRVQTQLVLTEEYDLQLNVELPQGRRLLAPVPPVRASVAGRGSELLSLRRFPAVITRAVPETLSSSTWVIELQPGDVRLPSGLAATVVDVAPRQIVLALDTIAQKSVPVVPVVVVPPESGSTVPSSVAATPDSVKVTGSPTALSRIDSVTTMPVELGGRPGGFRRVALVDSGPLAGVRFAPVRVVVTGEIGAILDRVLDQVPVESGAGGVSGITLTPPRVRVIVRGPEQRVRTFTRDSVQVLAHVAGSGNWARLTVVAPAGITARPAPDSVAVRRRSD